MAIMAGSGPGQSQKKGPLSRTPISTQVIGLSSAYFPGLLFGNQILKIFATGALRCWHYKQQLNLLRHNVYLWKYSCIVRYGKSSWGEKTWFNKDEEVGNHADIYRELKVWLALWFLKAVLLIAFQEEIICVRQFQCTHPHPPYR